MSSEIVLPAGPAAGEPPVDLGEVRRRVGSITHAERRELTDQLLGRADQETDADRRAELLDLVIAINLRIARAVSGRYAGRGVSRDDLAQAAAEGLVKAVHRFDPSRDQDLLSYAVPTIRGEVLRYFRDHCWTVRPPRRVQDAQHRLQRARDELALAHGREPSDEEVRTAAEVSAADSDEALTARGCFRPTSLDQPLETGAVTTLGDALPQDRDERAGAEARAVLHDHLPSLSPRDQRIVFLRYFEERTQHEIGLEFGVTQATVSRWLAESLDRLRDRIGSLDVI